MGRVGLLGESAAASEPRSDQEWVDFYAGQRGVYDAFTERLEDLVETLLDEAEVRYGWVVSFSLHPNAVGAALDRERRAGRSFERPLESTIRVAGVTVGVGTNGDVHEIGDVIRREFVVDPAGSLTIEAAAEADGRLDYVFPYYLVSLDGRRLELDEWSRFAGLKVRIEVQTELQESWKSIDNDLPFYRPEAYPPEIRDLIARSIHGLVQVEADVAEAIEAVTRLHDEYARSIGAGDLRLPVNGVSLHAYLCDSELVQSLVDLAVDVGLDPDPEYVPEWQTVEQTLFWLLDRDGIRTLAELDAFLRRATPRARDTLAEIGRVASDRGFVPWAFPEAVVEWLWLVLRRADAETIALVHYRDEIAYALNTLIGNPVPRDDPDDASRGPITLGDT